MSFRKIKLSIFLLGVIMLFVLVGCGSTTSSSSVGGGNHTASSASWAYMFVKWQGHTYAVTASELKKASIGKQIGKVTSYSNQETEESNDNFSNIYKKGTLYYAIKGTSTHQAIAIKKADSTYIKAVFKH